jgi:hypothetical protein
MQKQDTKPKLRADLTPEQREKAERIGRIEFKSAGAIRKPRDSADGACLISAAAIVVGLTEW